MKRALYIIGILVLMVTGFASSSTGGGIVVPQPDHGLRPMIFVHGYSGSGAQFGSQAMRFSSNFYPAEYIFAYDYDSTFTVNTMDDVFAGIDALVAAVKEKTGFDRVDILGHSLGTTILQGYLAYPDRAANIAHYVNIDGRTAPAPPGGVPTLAIWAGYGLPGREIVGATNVTIPGQTHVQVATSAQSFVEMYRFFTGNEPMISDIIPDPPDEVRLAGRVVYYPLNIGLPNARLEIWKVDAATGARFKKKPMVNCALGFDGSFGPIEVTGGESYEFAVIQEGDAAYTHHFYFEPFIRSDHLIRLLSSPRGQGVSALLDTGDNHSNVILQRYKELWGDQGAQNDAVFINGVDVVNAATCPVNQLINAMLVFDKGVDGVSDISMMLSPFDTLMFLSGVDLYIPGANPPDDTIQILSIPRGDYNHPQVVNAANWASSDDTISIMLNDYVQDIKSFPEWARQQGQ